MRSKIIIAIVAIVALLLGGVVSAKGSQSFLNLLADKIVDRLIGQTEEVSLGAGSATSPTYLDSGEWTRWNDGWFDDLEVEDDLYVLGDTSLTGNLSLTGYLNYKEDYSLTHNTATSTATTTLVAADSGTTYYVTSVSSTNFVLPATSTAAGTIYKFVVDGALTGDAHIYTANYSNIIEGSMIVAGAVVDCDAEDTITFVADGENVGDYIELRSNGVNWLIGSSGALTSAKMTCSTTT